MINWFPVTRALMEDTPEFTKLPPAHKLYYLLLVSEFNKQGPFYKADLDYTVQLGVSIETIRRARKNIEKIFPDCKIEPGWKSKRGNLATRYQHIAMPGLQDVRAVSERDEGEWFVKLHRFTFESLLARTQEWWIPKPEERLQLEDIVVYVTLWYWWSRTTQQKAGEFFITKRDLERVSGIQRATECVARLYQRFTFDNKAHLFEYVDKHQRLEFSQWGTFADPSENENNARVAERLQQRLAKAVADARKRILVCGRVLSPKSRKKAAEELTRYFAYFYYEAYGAWPSDTSSADAQARLERAIDTYGKMTVAQVIGWYWKSSDSPRRNAPKKTPFSYFLTSVLENGDLMKRLVDACRVAAVR